uniref:Uncharacterized protein n=1 Tax=Podoviridae sp. ctBev14 TaxID=2823556 RepID=A0A8S5LAZ1_9CAUD|nr:MAG TPA: hypothetical protein [Podoviridae sp. ctBev14]DAX34563.1 MAG TPA: hypothetical protein [Caudoviricetes sp.]
MEYILYIRTTEITTYFYVEQTISLPFSMS